MIVVGLTGSIGMGKSLTAAMLRKMGYPVHSADTAVHHALGEGGAAVEAVGALFPEALKDNMIDRKILGGKVFGDPEKLKQLEAILHPLVRRSEEEKIARAHANGSPAVILDIPLLFETGAETRCNAVICVTAPAWIQRRRVLKRPGMTEEKFARILAAQMPDAEKRRRANYIVQTGFGRWAAFRQLRRIMKRLTTDNIQFTVQK
ncbi:MAG: dephospho-CoA kinase [Alphaproteobacteria bacterium]